MLTGKFCRRAKRVGRITGSLLSGDVLVQWRVSAPSERATRREIDVMRNQKAGEVAWVEQFEADKKLSAPPSSR